MKISLITISYNNPKDLEKTIKSVKKNYFKKLEYIVVLGSNDQRSQNILKKNNSFISKIISEPDRGIYDALNKGIKNSTGDIICFVHSGDTLNRGYFKAIIQNIKKNDYIYGNINLVTRKNNKLVIESKKVNRFHNNIFRLPILHPGLIVKKKVFKKIGNFHNKLILSDKLWMLKLIKSNFLGKKINNVLVNFKMNGSSSKYIILKEYYYLLKKNKDNFFKIVFILIKLFLVITYYKYIYYVK